MPSPTSVEGGTVLRLVTAVLAALALAPTAGAENVRFSTFNASLEPIGCRPADRRSLDAGQPAGPERGRDDPAGPAGRAPHQRVRLRRRRDRARALPGQLPLGLAERRRADRLSVPLRRRVEHRHPVRLRPEQQRRDRRRRTTPTASGPTRASSGWRSTPGTHRPHRDPHLPALPLAGHAGRAAPGRPGDAGADGLVLAGGARGLPALVEEPLGSADRDRRPGRCTS